MIREEVTHHFLKRQKDAHERIEMETGERTTKTCRESRRATLEREKERVETQKEEEEEEGEGVDFSHPGMPTPPPPNDQSHVKFRKTNRIAKPKHGSPLLNISTPSFPENAIRGPTKPSPGKCRKIPGNSGFPIK